MHDAAGKLPGELPRRHHPAPNAGERLASCSHIMWPV